MVWFVALVAILNVVVGYGVAVYLGAVTGRNPFRRSASVPDSGRHGGEHDDVYPYSTDESSHYADHPQEPELVTAAAD